MSFSIFSGRGDGVVGVWSPLDGVGPARGRRAGGSGRRGLVSGAGAPRRRLAALRLPYDGRQRSEGGWVLTVIFKKKSHRENSADLFAPGGARPPSEALQGRRVTQACPSRRKGRPNEAPAV